MVFLRFEKRAYKIFHQATPVAIILDEKNY